jgi:hypothetical protein
MDSFLKLSFPRRPESMRRMFALVLKQQFPTSFDDGFPPVRE